MEWFGRSRRVLRGVVGGLSLRTSSALLCLGHSDGISGAETVTCSTHRAWSWILILIIITMREACFYTRSYML